jgi:predicted nuclease of restriction endonuclease-like (RecB) superfamily
MENLDDLSKQIFEVHHYFKIYAFRQINNALTLRNWMTGYYLVEYEQQGKDRAAYGGKTLIALSEKLSKTGAKGFSDRNLRLYRQFYLEYPAIWQYLTAKFQNSNNQPDTIWQFPIAKSQTTLKHDPKTSVVPVEVLMEKLSYTHFVELIKITEPLKRAFYELQIIKNNWNVQQLQRSFSSMLYERIGLSADKNSILQKLTNENLQQFTDVIKSPYILEFLGIEEKAEYSETDLEQAIINHLQKFLIELGRGFCFEARQKRISFQAL